MQVSEDGRPANAGVWFPPPLVYVIPFFAAFLLNDRIEFLIVGGGAGPVQQAAGAVMLVAGLLTMLSGLMTFGRFGINALPFRPARQLAVAGPYKFTRNPMYLGLLIAYLGGILKTNWAWPLVFLPFVLMVMNGYVIAREERYLSAAFGAEYTDYCRRVRRWL